MFILGIPFAILLASWFASDPYYADGRINQIVVSVFLACWLVLSSLLVRKVKVTYWCIHIAVWMIGGGIAFYQGSLSKSVVEGWKLLFFWLLLPLGISLVLIILYKLGISALSHSTIFRHTDHQPEAEDPRGREYQQGSLRK